MKAIRVIDLPDDLYLKLRFSAAVNHTSLEKEIISCLEKALKPKKIKMEKKKKALILLDQLGDFYKADDLKEYLDKIR